MTRYRTAGLVAIASLILPVAAQEPAEETETDAAAVETDTEESAQNPATGMVTRSTINGSYSYGPGGNLKIDSAFTGSTLVFDPATGGVMKVNSGVSKDEFVAMAEKSNVGLEHLSETEIKAGTDIFVFEDGKLTRMKTGY